MWRESFASKTFMSAGGSLIVSVFFALYNAFLGIAHRSPWNGSIAVYYILLSIIRGTIIFTEHKLHRIPTADEKYRRKVTFLFSSALMVVMNTALIVPLTMMVKMEKPGRFGLIPVLIMSVYTAYKIIAASINFRRRRTSAHLFVRELRSISLMDALLSIATLQNALIVYEGAEHSRHMLILSAIVCAFLLIMMIAISIQNLVKGLQEIKQYD